MKYLYYFTNCLFPLAHKNKVPPLVFSKNKEYVSLLSKIDNKWLLSYERGLSNEVHEILCDVSSRFEFIVHIKMLLLLYRKRKEIKLTFDRLEYNLECIKTLEKIAKKVPDWRFMQLLFNLGLCDDLFYEEPSVTLEHLKTQLERFSNEKD